MDCIGYGLERLTPGGEKARPMGENCCSFYLFSADYQVKLLNCKEKENSGLWGGTIKSILPLPKLLPPNGQQFLNSHFISPKDFGTAGGGDDATGYFFGNLALGQAAVERIKNFPAFDHHCSFMFGKSQVEQFMKFFFRVNRLEELV